MSTWIRFDHQTPSEGAYIAAITQRDDDSPVEAWEVDLEKNAVGTWVDGVVWEGNLPLRGFTHWLPLPDRPHPLPASRQTELWYRTVAGILEPEQRRTHRDHP